MSELEDYQYTPTVEDMRGYYKDTWFYAPHTNSEEEKNGEFDRFLQAVLTGERERIIALLEAEMPPCDGHNAHYCGRECDVLSFIAFIRGEQK